MTRLVDRSRVDGPHGSRRTVKEHLLDADVVVEYSAWTIAGAAQPFWA
jgi:hypothetical protein